MISATFSIPSFVNNTGGRVRIVKSVPGQTDAILVDVMVGMTSADCSGSLSVGESIKLDPAGTAEFSIPFSGSITNAASVAMTLVPSVGAASVVGSADAVQVTASYSGAFTKRNDRLELKVA